MPRVSTKWFLPAMLACALVPAAARAADSESVVAGSGTASIDKPADTLRLQVQVNAEGKDVKEAIEKLKTRLASIKTGLVNIGADDKSFDPGTIAVNDGTSPEDQQSALQRAMRDRLSGGRGGAAASTDAPKVTVVTVIKAEWPLKADTSEAMIVAAATIKGQIKSSKLLNAPKEALSEEEQEAAAMASSENEPQPGQPLYTFVAKISDAEQTKAMADAFGKAKAAALRLAKAAGSDLGALKSISGQVTSDPEEAFAMRQYGNSAYMREALLDRYGGGGKDQVEAVGPQPGKVSLQVVVNAEFAIK